MVFIKKRDLFVGEHTIDDRRNVSLEQVYPKVVCKDDTPALPLSDYFWARYKSVQDLRQKTLSQRTENNLEARAKSNLKELYSRGDIQTSYNFMSVLIEDIEEYGTLPPRTLRRISEIPKDGDALVVVKELSDLENSLGGGGYLQKLKDNLPDQSKELIIAVENQ